MSRSRRAASPVWRPDMAKMKSTRSGLLLSAMAWTAMAVTTLGLIAPDIAQAAARPDERGANRGQRSMESRGRASDRVSRPAQRERVSRPTPRERATAAARANRPGGEANRSSGRGWMDIRKAQQDREAARRVQQQTSRPDRDRSWSGNRPRTEDRNNHAWRPGGTNNDRRDDRRDNWRNDRNNNWRDNDRRDRDNDWRRGSDRGGSAWRDRDNRRWDRNEWRRDKRYDWQRHRASHRSIYRIGRYYAPYRDYSYRRLSIGFSLGSMFYGSQYWINDPWQYRLPEVYGPYRWVRYYDDVLLVDIHSGEVVDVIYNFFW